MASNKKNIIDIQKEKSERLMDGVGYWAAFYRKNPQRFVKEYLNINLKLFQKILIYMMMVSTHFCYIASRGQGKSWLIALYCTVRCILFPGTKICIASGVKSQAIEIIEKIDTDFKRLHEWGSSNLNNEIAFISTSVNVAKCEFKNGSWIKVVTANDNARHNRANIIVVDEFRMVDKGIVDSVIKKFLTAPREPGFLNLPEYKDYPLERNCELYASSAWYKDHWIYKKVVSFFKNMLDDKRRYFCVGLPYQIALKEKLLSREQVADDMAEDDFDEVSWRMEMETEFYGDSDGAFYKYDDVSKCRRIKNAYLPLEMYERRGINIPELALNERRIMSVDVALMSSGKHRNDATAIEINIAIPNETSYKSNFVYIETFEGLTTDELGITVMRYFNKYNCTDLVLDCAGVGLGVYDFIIREQYDPITGETYEAMCSCNNDEMAERCKVINPLKVVWCIKANAEFNSNAATALRAGIQNGNINLLINEYDAEEIVKKVPNYKSLSETEKTTLLLPYVQTSLLINEMINLDHEIVNNKVKLKERPGMRKDRFSSMEYNYYVTQILANQLRPTSTEDEILDLMITRPSKRQGAF